MPSLKNQHFVPRCLLKPFTYEGEGNAINLYNIRSDRLIKGAPVKGQCARNYLYGKDGKLETALAQLEGHFSASRARALSGDFKAVDLHNMNLFTYLQFRRTEMAAQRLRESYEAMNTGVYENRNAPEIPSNHQLVLWSLRMCMETREYVEDLKIRIIENQTEIDFVICDDPSIFTNRYAAQRLGRESFGVSSSGVFFVLPLAPQFAIICYDGLVYTVPDLDRGRIVLKKGEEVETLNELQNLKAGENLYFSDWSNADYVRNQFHLVKDNRPKEWSKIKHLVPVPNNEGREVYREGTLDEAKKAGTSLVQLSFAYPQPSRWFPPLKFRSKPRTYYNGTAIGHVRKADWLRSRG
jgi:hypothetical protein